MVKSKDCKNLQEVVLTLLQKEIVADVLILERAAKLLFKWK